MDRSTGCLSAIFRCLNKTTITHFLTISFSFLQTWPYTFQQMNVGDEVSRSPGWSSEDNSPPGLRLSATCLGDSSSCAEGDVEEDHHHAPYPDPKHFNGYLPPEHRHYSDSLLNIG